MAERTISVTQGKGNLMHNNRTYEGHGYHTPDHIDIMRTHLNKIYIQQDIRDAYKEVFSDAIEEYNAKQKRSDRRIKGIDGYMASIRQDDKKKLFYETVVQIGDMQNCNAKSDDGKLAAHFLEKYLNEFRKANPNIHVFNAVLHMDEQTPHLHLDWFPVARGYKRGIQVQQSLVKGLEQQGVKMPEGQVATRHNNLCMQWYEVEKNRIANIMRDTWERAKDSGVHREHEDVQTFKHNREVAKKALAKHKVQKIERQETGFGKNRGEKVLVNAQELDQLEERARIKNFAIQNAQKLESSIKDTYQDINSIRKRQVMVINSLERKESDLDTDRQLLELQYRHFEDKEKEVAALPGKVEELQKQNNNLILQVQALNATLSSYQAELERQEQEVVAPLREELLEKDNEITSLKAQIDDLRQSFKEKLDNIKAIVLEGRFDDLVDMFKPKEQKQKAEFVCKSHNHDIYKRGKDWLVVKAGKVKDTADTLEKAKHKAYLLSERGR